MELKEAVAIAKAYAAEAFSDEELSHVRLEEIEQDQATDDWLVTLGLYRPSPQMTLNSFRSVLGETNVKRALRVFRISNSQGIVRSVKIRDTED